MSRKETHTTIKLSAAVIILSQMLNQSKKIDELKLLPAQVKDGMLLDFSDNLISKVDGQADCIIFKLERVNSAQAVTQALKRDYTAALEKWVSGDEPKVEETKAPEAEDSVDLISDIKELLHLGKLKKAKKLIKDNPDHDKIKKATKLYKKATEASE